MTPGEVAPVQDREGYSPPSPRPGKCPGCGSVLHPSCVQKHRICCECGGSIPADELEAIRARLAAPTSAETPGESGEEAITMAKKQKAQKKTAEKAQKEGARKSSEPLKVDPRLPAPGTVLKCTFKSKPYEVKVLDGGQVEYDGRVFKSISAAGKAIVKGSCNGFVLFRLNKPPKKDTEAAA